jgi:membrane associated rhomboid family serine protease/TolA-binding protein
MNLNQFSEKLDRELNQHPDKSLVIKSLLLIFVIIGARLCLGSWFLPILTLCFINYLVFISANPDKGILRIIWENLSFFDVPRTSCKDSIERTAWATWVIIIVNCLVYFFLEIPSYEFVENNLICLPYAPTLINYPLSFLTSMYLHADILHLFGNMTFFWATGTLVERRIGWKQFLVAYHITGLLGNAFSVVVYAGILSEDAHGLGASGAIAGIMGVYIVRCYFKKMILPLPLFGFLPINLNIQMNSFAVIGLFFALNLRGGLGQLLGSTTTTDYWAHLGGIAGGLWIAYRMKLADKAIEERHRERGSSLIDGKTIVSKAYEEVGGFANAEKSLMIALEKDSQNTDTLVALARLHSHFKPSEEGCDYYLIALRILLSGNSPKITTVFKEFFSTYHTTIEAESQYKIASLLYREGEYDLASRTLEMLVEHPHTPEPLRERSMLLAAKLLDKLSLHEAAQVYYERFTECYPFSQHYSFAHQRSGTLRGS